MSAAFASSTKEATLTEAKENEPKKADASDIFVGNADKSGDKVVRGHPAGEEASKDSDERPE